MPWLHFIVREIGEIIKHFRQTTFLFSLKEVFQSKKKKTKTKSERKWSQLGSGQSLTVLPRER